MDRTLVLNGLLALSLQFGIGSTATGQSSPKTAPQPEPPAFGQEVGGLYSRYDRAAWQSPEAVFANLHSKTDNIRLNAFHLLGAIGEDAWEFMPRRVQLLARPLHGAKRAKWGGFRQASGRA